ncbi:MAG: carboxypeptidase regulatory-like domain-containing protein [Gemmatimonadetes bacterium]|nr:carboxypeptidase regulatory-like domain-containing protein [Gemmatimonadota bacterium]
MLTRKSATGWHSSTAAVVLALGVASGLALASAPHAAWAQSVRGSVVDRGAIPVPGVVVQLLDTESVVVARALTDGRGLFHVSTLRAGTYRVRTLRIGWRPVTSEPIALAAGEEVARNFELTGVALALDTVRIGTTSLCRLTGPAAATTFAIWDQARTALAATELTARTRTLNATTVMYERHMDAAATRTLQADAQLQTGFVAQPWSSVSADSLRKVGYVTMEGNGEATYLAPGLDVLASDSFIDDHCFRIIAAPEPDLIGISFEPTSERRSVSDIRGTIWLDRGSSELRSIEFRYTNIPAVQEQEARGSMDFARMTDGSWAISSWSIRMPVIGMVPRPRGMGGTQIEVVEIRVAGGELAVARRGTDTLWARTPFTVSGTLLDSASGRPVTGARVQVQGTPVAGTSRDDGRFSLAGVLPGNYRLEIRTPSLDSIGARHSVPFTLMLADTSVDARVPNAQQLVGTICGGTRGRDARAASTGLVLGTIRSSDGSMPLNAAVVAEWTMGRDSGSRWVEARADMSGGFRLCGLPANTAIILRAQTANASATPIGVRIPGGGSFARAELTLDRPAEGSAVFIGTVVADSANQPVARAEIAMPELGLSALADERGVFRIYDIPAGAHRVIARRVGYAPLDTRVEFAPNQAVDRRIVLTHVTELDAAIVLGASGLPLSFDENRNVGIGHFLTRDDLIAHRGRPLSLLFRNIPGAGVVNSRANTAWLMSTRVPPSLGGAGIYFPQPFEVRQGMPAGCYAKVYLDNILMNPGSPTEPFDINTFGAEQVEAIEFYASAAQTPLKYATLDSNCGVLVIWRRR